ncbi:MAG TPA: radical SAM protein, partial [Bacteroidales bacterium]|nr:radical SAM protein [Bacteroidales bacterium]
QNHLDKGSISGIRISTRPDYIDNKTLEILRSYRVTHIELGAQSTSDKVLQASGRGHSRETIFRASEQVLAAGFILGLQMMIGLPQDTAELCMKTAKELINFGVNETRIYPCLVIKDTALEKLYRAGKYQPLSLVEAVNQTAKLYTFFESYGIKVLRMGLHPSEELNTAALVAGPYHPQFAELVYSKLWEELFQSYTDWPKTDVIDIIIPPSQINYAAGFRSHNRKLLEKRYRKVHFKVDKSLIGRTFKVNITNL